MDLMLRVPANIRLNGKVYNLIEEHNAVFQLKGKVAVAKFGAPFSQKVVESITSDLSGGQPKLYLVSKEDDHFRAVSARITAIGGISQDRSLVGDLFPDYYNQIGDCPASYVMLGSKLSTANLNALRLVSNGRPVIDVIRECRTATSLIAHMS